MEHAQQVELIDQLLLYLDEGRTAQADAVRGVEVAAYYDPALQEEESQVFFREHPLVAALSADIARPGDFLTQELLDTPVLLVRGRDGVARAFVNACRHRGARVEGAPCGSRKLFSCPFHAWGYDTEGRLAAVPHEQAFGVVDKAALSLTPLPTAERYGIIWVLLQPNGPNFEIDSYLGGLAPELASWELDQAEVVARDRLPARMNWKLAVDTFGETYHFDVLHKESVHQAFHANVQLYEIFGRNHRMVFAGKGLETLKDQPRDSWRLRPQSLVVYYLFPNTQLIVQRRGVSLFRIFPNGADPHASTTEMTFYAERPLTTPEERVLAQFTFERTRDVIRDEDYAMAQMAQRSLAAGAQRYAVFGRNEPALQHYHGTYRAALGRGPLPIL
jgi:phenylpropionate dioxygenase-like ring-hydroxylating dioxygenase large terminal subunit